MISKDINFKITSGLGNELTLNETDLKDIRILEREGNSLVFLLKDKRHEASILSSDDSLKNVKIRINNQTIDLKLEDNLDLLIKEMGLSQVEEELGGDIYAPMPGLVLNILVKEGDVVKQGDSIMVLEAMKMENLLQASADGIIAKINCKKGSTVEKGTLLVEVEIN